MKRSNLYLKQIILLLGLSVCLSACKTQSEFFRTPFQDFTSDAFYFRAVGYGEDTDIQLARSKAIHLAKVEMARNIRSVCQQTITNYILQTSTGDNVELKEKFESISTESISESLAYVTVKDVVFKKEKNDRYTCYAKIEMPTTHVRETLAGQSRDKIDLQADSFEQAYGKVLSEMNTPNTK
ncbi:MAG: hypothetical protein LBQ65_09915 [Tannerellaceae bacterium]|jgi:hypothetical protein|nr:hypothetical protein [Tannerellaceae bacterium]